MSLHHIVYLSTAVQQMSDAELQELLTQARSFNLAHRVTGVLLYHEGQFVQVMEGEEAVVRSLYENIRRDARHNNVVKLADKNLASRSFGDWSMAFLPINDEAFASLSGFAHPEQLAKAAEQGEHADPLLAQIVHLTFHQEADLS